MNTTLLPNLTILLGGVSTIAIFSFLYRENPLYRFFEHLFIGIATAIGIMAAVRFLIWPEIVTPLFGLDVITFPDGTTAQPYDRSNLWLLLPMAFGSLYYFILSPKRSWVAQIVIGFSLGISGGLAFKAILNEMLPQLFDCFRPLYIPGDIESSLSNIVFLVVLLTTMSYFLFTTKQNAVLKRSASFGRWAMMGCFGAFFGATIMARMALLVERLEFLINQWWPTLAALISGNGQ